MEHQSALQEQIREKQRLKACTGLLRISHPHLQPVSCALMLALLLHNIQPGLTCNAVPMPAVFMLHALRALCGSGGRAAETQIR